MKFRNSRLTLSNSRFDIWEVTDCASLGINIHTKREYICISHGTSLLLRRLEETLVLIQRARVSIRSELRSTQMASFPVSCNLRCELHTEL